jgi:hypothetical protein
LTLRKSPFRATAPFVAYFGSRAHRSNTAALPVERVGARFAGVRILRVAFTGPGIFRVFRARARADPWRAGRGAGRLC